MKKLVFPLLFLLFGFTTQAQYGYDYGISLGFSNYLGEIGSNSEEAQGFLLDTELSQTRLSAGGFFRYNFTERLGAKLNLNYARISGADSLAVAITALARNLSFRTDIFEASVVGEYSFFTFNDLTRSSRQRVDFKTYIFGGAGIALYYPHAERNGEYFSLRELATEGIENQYDEFTVIIPAGAGLNFTFNKKIRLGLDMGYRFTFTDYLDDVSTRYADPAQLPTVESQFFSNRTARAYESGRVSESELSSGFFRPGSRRGNPETNDGYLIFQFQLSFVVQNKSSFYKSRYNSIINRRRKRTKF